MTCIKNNKRGTEILLAYAARTVDASDRAALERHASECSECRELLDAQRRLWNLLDSVEAPEVSADFDARLYSRIAREESGSSWKAGVVGWLRGFAPGSFLWNAHSWKPVMAGAMAAAVLGVGFYLHSPLHAPATQPAPSSSSAAAAAAATTRGNQQIRPESVDAEQMEVTVEDLEMLMPPGPAGRM
jgi:anti-sigma factor RsiW